MKLSGLIPKFLLILVIFICSGSNLLFAKDIHFFDVQEELLNRINELRTHPRVIAQQLGLNPLIIGQTWQEMDFRVPFYQVELNENLTEMAKAHIIEMIDKEYIGHQSDAGNTLEQRARYFGYNGIFNGESIAVFCFENFVSVDNAINILWRDMVKDAFYRISAEGAPLLFPLYKDLGVALAGTQITLNGNRYNAYILCIEFGIPQFSGYFVGRIYHNKPLPEYGIYNLEIKSFQENNPTFIYSLKNLFLDGSFFVPWDGISDLWIEINDKTGVYPLETIIVYTPTVYIKL